MKELIHQGSVKDVYRLSPTEIEFVFSDRISVYDKPIPNPIPGKGGALCAMACHWFSALDRLGLPHHFLERTGETTMRVKAVEPVATLKDRPKPWRRLFIPLECIQRHYMAGSLFDRLGAGRVSSEALGFAPGAAVGYGAKLPRAFFEMSTKFEAFDRLLTRQEAIDLAGVDEGIIDEIQTFCLRIDGMIALTLAEASFFHVDGKKEFGFDEEGRLMVVDVFGTLDEDRFWDRAAYEERGETIELSKEAVRQHYRAIGYKDALYGARQAGTAEPPIPPLPDPLVADTAALYARVAGEVTGNP